MISRQAWLERLDSLEDHKDGAALPVLIGPPPCPNRQPSLSPDSCQSGLLRGTRNTSRTADLSTFRASFVHFPVCRPTRSKLIVGLMNHICKLRVLPTIGYDQRTLAGLLRSHSGPRVLADPAPIHQPFGGDPRLGFVPIQQERSGSVWGFAGSRATAPIRLTRRIHRRQCRQW
jgi:hypothetical protein